MNTSGGDKKDTEGEERECGEKKAISATWDVQKDRQCRHVQALVMQGAGGASWIGEE